MELLNHNATELKIFENFQIDRRLPKYQTGIRKSLSDPTDEMGAKMGTPEDWGQSDVSMANGIFTIGGTGNNAWITEGDSRGPVKPIPAWKRCLLGLKREPKIIYKYSVEEFFKSIKNSTSELKRVDERIESFNLILKQAQEFGQTALVENMQGELKVIQSETQLYAIKLTTIITEEQVIKFAKDSERGLHLDWIKNFTRVIPSKLLKTKAKADELKIFDNYVILHYDPQGKNTQLTKKEIEKKKDPILFGVIAGSRKLYYIGDWIDEYCDLTLEAFVDKFGKDSINQNNITANIKGIV